MAAMRFARTVRPRHALAVAAVALAGLLAGCAVQHSPSAHGPQQPAAGTAATFTVRTVAGTTTTLPGSRPVVLLFFSVECGGCGPSARALATAQAADPAAADFAAINEAGETAPSIDGFLRANHASTLGYSIDTTGALVARYGVSQLSTVVILDPHGVVTYRAVEPDAATIEGQLRTGSG